MSSDSSSHSDLQIGKLSVTIILGDARAEFSGSPEVVTSIGEQFHFETDTRGGSG